MDYNIKLIKMVLHLLNSEVKLLFNEETDDDFDDLIIAKHGLKKKHLHIIKYFNLNTDL